MPSENLGDFWPSCPAEWSPRAAIATAATMERNHGSRLEAHARALEYRGAYYPATWGYRHWTYVAELLEGMRTEAQLLALEVPAAGWPSNPTALSPLPLAESSPAPFFVLTPDPQPAKDVAATLHAMRTVLDGPLVLVDPPVASPAPGSDPWPRWWEERGIITASLVTKPLTPTEIEHAKAAKQQPPPAASEPEQGSLF